MNVSVNQKRPDQSAVVWVVHHLEGNAAEIERPGRIYALDAHD